MSSWKLGEAPGWESHVCEPFNPTLTSWPSGRERRTLEALETSQITVTVVPETFAVNVEAEGWEMLIDSHALLLRTHTALGRR
jgi:hypothetical protein